MKKLILGAVITLFGIVTVATPAYAWAWKLKADVVCVSGTSKVTFTLDNTGEPEPATVRTSNHPDLVPIGTVIPKKGTVKTAAVSTPYTLTLGVNWPSDALVRNLTVKAESKTCTQPTTTTTAKPFKVSLCHATSSETNPYVLINVAAEAVYSGHDDHDGDIIPPFADYPGKNWDAAHKAIFNNGCKVVPPTTTTTVPPTTTTTTTPPTTTTTIPPTTTTTIIVTTTTTAPPATTTTVPTATTTTAPPVTTTVPPVVTTTTAPPQTTTTTALVPVTTTIVPEDPTTTTKVVKSPPVSLPETGLETDQLIVIGAVLIVIGLILSMLGLKKN